MPRGRAGLDLIAPERPPSKASQRSLFDINVAACEDAKRRKCICPCKGKLHGKKHSARWRRQVFDDLYAEAE